MEQEAGKSSRIAAGLLTARQREAWWYRRVEGLSDTQAAQRMGVCRESFNRLYHRAESRIRAVERLFGRLDRDLIEEALKSHIAPLTFRLRGDLAAVA